MVTVTRFYRFEAAHKLPEVYGDSSRVHGHSYTVGVTLGGGTPTELLDAAWENLRQRLDHRLLNDEWEDTTVEGLAKAIGAHLQGDEWLVREVWVQEGDLRRGTWTP